jgi:hypothetical protein
MATENTWERLSVGYQNKTLRDKCDALRSEIEVILKKCIKQ